MHSFSAVYQKSITIAHMPGFFLVWLCEGAHAECHVHTNTPGLVYLGLIQTPHLHNGDVC